MLHQQYGTTYYLASRLFERSMQMATDAVYGFVRVPDEWVDNPGEASREEQMEKLRGYRAQLIAGVEQRIRPENSVLRAFTETVISRQILLSDALCFLDAMEMDLYKFRYSNYTELESYMLGSAAAVGLMMLPILGLEMSNENRAAATSLGNAMQLTNFIRDVSEDWDRGRLYLPQDELQSFGVTEEMIRKKEFTPELRRLIQFQVERAQREYEKADEAISRMPKQPRRAVKLARVLYSKILDVVESQDYNVFLKRARTSKAQKLVSVAKVFLT